MRKVVKRFRSLTEYKSSGVARMLPKPEAVLSSRKIFIMKMGPTYYMRQRDLETINKEKIAYAAYDFD